MSKVYAALAIAVVIALLGWYGHSATWDAATAAADKSWQGKIDAANVKAKKDHDDLQAKIDAQAAASNPVLKAQFDKLQATLDDMRTHPNAYVMPRPTRPLPPDCKLDQAVVDAANKALAQ